MQGCRTVLVQTYPSKPGKGKLPKKPPKDGVRLWTANPGTKNATTYSLVHISDRTPKGKVGGPRSKKQYRTGSYCFNPTPAQKRFGRAASAATKDCRNRLGPDATIKQMGACVKRTWKAGRVRFR